MDVVYFDQQMGASHTVHWLKSSCLVFYQLFPSQMGKRSKTAKTKEKYKKTENRVYQGLGATLYVYLYILKQSYKIFDKK